MAEALGIDRKTYRRLELGDSPNPGLRVLANAAIALGVELEDLVEDRFRRWEPFGNSPAEPPTSRAFSRRGN
jgi:transcriptional regulator with XRE-family HTH domain